MCFSANQSPNTYFENECPMDIYKFKLYLVNRKETRHKAYVLAIKRYTTQHFFPGIWEGMGRGAFGSLVICKLCKSVLPNKVLITREGKWLLDQHGRKKERETEIADIFSHLITKIAMRPKRKKEKKVLNVDRQLRLSLNLRKRIIHVYFFHQSDIRSYFLFSASGVDSLCLSDA